MNHSLKVTKTEAGKEGTLSLAGDLTMAEAQETKRTLLDAIGAVDTLLLDLQKIGSVDVSFIQLLCAAHRECFMNGKEIFLMVELSDFIATLIERAGYTKQCGCLTGAKESCLWDTSSWQ